MYTFKRIRLHRDIVYSNTGTEYALLLFAVETFFTSLETCIVATRVQYSCVALHVTCLLASNVNFLE